MSTLAHPPAASPLEPPRPAAVAPPAVDVVVPVHDERAAVERSVRRLHRFLTDELPFAWRIVVAEHGSTDDTAAIAERLARELPGVRVLRLREPGRGRALRAVWAQSDARVVAYMDVDLSTDLRALLPLIAPLLSGHSELAIGTRLARGARVVRGPKDSRVRIVATALADLRGVARLLVASHVVRFLAIGVASTLAYALLGTLVYLLTLGLTSGAVATLHGLAPHASRPVELTVLVLAGLAATATRYVALRSWVFARARRGAPPPVASAAR
jgi:hypothetical protein